MILLDQRTQEVMNVYQLSLPFEQPKLNKSIFSWKKYEVVLFIIVTLVLSGGVYLLIKWSITPPTTRIPHTQRL